MLRKFLGDKKVAHHIWQIGLPSIADPVIRRSPCKLPEREILCMLQSGMEVCLHWYASLANAMAIHVMQEGHDLQRSLGSLHERDQQEQQTRREAIHAASERLRLGNALRQQRVNQGIWAPAYRIHVNHSQTCLKQTDTMCLIFRIHVKHSQTWLKQTDTMCLILPDFFSLITLASLFF